MLALFRWIIDAFSRGSDADVMEAFSQALREGPRLPAPPAEKKRKRFRPTARHRTQQRREVVNHPAPSSAPKYLYKYCSAARGAQILRDRYIYLCSMENLNDVFEGSVSPGLRYAPALARELRVRQIVAAGCNREMAEEVAAKTSSIDEDRKLFDVFAKSILDANRALRSSSGVACFSSSFSNQRLWGTYGDAHQGICLQFWSDEGRSVVHERARPVIYTNQDRSDLLLRALDERGDIPFEALGFLFYLMKSVDWQNEDEWRILMLRNTKPSEDDRRLSFPPSNLRRIFFGPRIPLKDRRRITDIAREFSADWTLLDIKIDVDAGRSNFVGVELLKGTEDFDWWFPKSR